jgi:hypothetical protein
MTTSKSRTARIAETATTIAIAIAALAATGTTASATTTSSTDQTAATSNGFECSSEFGWVRQNWPDISVRSSASTDVSVRSQLFRWDGGQWQLVQTGDTYVGVSTVSGSQPLGTDLIGQPYYFALPGQPSTLPPERGQAFLHLAPGFYTTLEEYSAMGTVWQAANRVAGTDLVGCQI